MSFVLWDLVGVTTVKTSMNVTYWDLTSVMVAYALIQASFLRKELKKPLKVHTSKSFISQKKIKKINRQIKKYLTSN